MLRSHPSFYDCQYTKRGLQPPKRWAAWHCPRSQKQTQPFHPPDTHPKARRGSRPPATCAARTTPDAPRTRRSSSSTGGTSRSAATLQKGTPPSDMWVTTLDNLQGMVDDDVRAKGAALCIAHGSAQRDPLPGRPRFDVMSVCVNLEVGRVRVHHVREPWQS